MNVDIEYDQRPARRTLVDRRAPEDEREERTQKAEGLRRIAVGPRTLSTWRSPQVFSPLTGFMVRDDYESVVDSMRLANGLVWSMPITLSVSEDEAREIGEARR